MKAPTNTVATDGIEIREVPVSGERERERERAIERARARERETVSEVTFLD
jgi:hypothetical protein